MKRFDDAAAGVDDTKPNVARIYDCALGGKNYYEADRQAFEEMLRFNPGYPRFCQRSRAFLGRVVREAVTAGIRQFLDLGSGLPTQQNVHQIAHEVAPGSPVVYVDYDQVAVAEARALLGGPVNAWVIHADIRHPRQILDHPDAQYPFLNWDEPMLILLVSVLHFITDEEGPAGIVRQFADAAAPGSWLAIAHGTTKGIDPRAIVRAQDLYDGASAPWVPRRAETVVRWLDGMRILEPGAVLVDAWRPAPEDTGDAEEVGIFGVVAEVMPRAGGAAGG